MTRPRDQALVDVCVAMQRADEATAAGTISVERHGAYTIQGVGGLWVVYQARRGRLGARRSLSEARMMVVQSGGTL